VSDLSKFVIFLLILILTPIRHRIVSEDEKEADEEDGACPQAEVTSELSSPPQKRAATPRWPLNPVAHFLVDRSGLDKS
jgi:hypothetical protein